MPYVRFGNLAMVQFPDDWTKEQIAEDVRANKDRYLAGLRDRLSERAAAETAQDPQNEASGVLENLGKSALNLGERAGSTAGSLPKMIGRAAELLPTEPFVQAPGGFVVVTPEQRAQWDQIASQRASETPEQLRARLESNPLVVAGKKIQDATHSDTLDALAKGREGFWTADVPGAIGTTVAGVGAGLLAGPPGAMAAVFGAEAEDAWDEELQRQAMEGEPYNPDKALLKAYGYGGFATAVEMGLGVGRLVRQLRKTFGGTAKEAVEKAARTGALRGFLARTAKEASAGFTEESTQRLGESLIVHGKPDVAGAIKEGVVGAVVQGGLSAPANVVEARRGARQRSPIEEPPLPGMEEETAPPPPPPPGSETPPPGSEAPPPPGEEPPPGAETPPPPEEEAPPTPEEDELTRAVAESTGGEVKPRLPKTSEAVSRMESESGVKIEGVAEAAAKARQPDETKPAVPPMPQATAGEATGVPEPESAASILEQIRLTEDPNSTKAATLITTGTEIPDFDSDVLMAVKTKHGTVIFHPDKVGPDEIAEAAKGKVFDGRILGMASPGKPVKSSVAVSTSTPDARNVVTELVDPTPEAIAAATQAQQAAVPGGTTEVKPAAQVVMERREDRGMDPEGAGAAVAGAGKGVVQSLYDALWEQAKKGSIRLAGNNDPVLVRAKPLVSSGQIQSAEDFHAWVNSGNQSPDWKNPRLSDSPQPAAPQQAQPGVVAPAPGGVVAPAGGETTQPNEQSNQPRVGETGAGEGRIPEGTLPPNQRGGPAPVVRGERQQPGADDAVDVAGEKAVPEGVQSGFAGGEPQTKPKGGVPREEGQKEEGLPVTPAASTSPAPETTSGTPEPAIAVGDKVEWTDEPGNVRRTGTVLERNAMGVSVDDDASGRKYLLASSKLRRIETHKPTPAPAPPPTPETKKLRKLEHEEGKAATANEPKTSTPKVLKVQREFLLGAVTKAIAEAPDKASTPLADADTAAVDAIEKAHGEELRANYGTSKTTDANIRRTQALEPFFQKYGIEKTVKVDEGNSGKRKIKTHTLDTDSRLKLLRDAIAKSRWQSEAKIVFDVPGDGVFTVVNDKETLKKFRGMVEKRFPKGTGVATSPGLKSVSGKEAPKAKEDLEFDERLKALRPFVSEDEGRRVITRVYHDGDILIATDGRHMAAIPAGEKAEEGKQFDPETGKQVTEEPNPEPIKTTHKDGRVTETPGDKELRPYPNYREVLPSDPEWRAKLPLAPWLKMLRQALQLWADVERGKTRSVALYLDPEGNIGVNAVAPDLATYKSGISPKSKLLAAFNVEYLIEGLELAARMGNTEVWVSSGKGEETLFGPMGIMGKDFAYVIMPMRTDGALVTAYVDFSTSEAKSKSTELSSAWMDFWNMGSTGESNPEKKPASKPAKRAKKKSKDAEYRREDEPEVDIWTASDEELEDFIGRPPEPVPGQAAPTTIYSFASDAEFQAWMDARYVERDLDGMALGYADAPTKMKVAFIKANRNADQTKRDVINTIATGAPLPQGWTPVPRTTPRPNPPSMPQVQTAPPPPGRSPGPPGGPSRPSRPGPPPPPPRNPSQYRKFSVTALVQLFRLFGNSPRINRVLKSAYGRYTRADRNVQLKERLFWDSALAKRVLAHEIGHFIDLAVHHVGTGKSFANRWQPLVDFRTMLWRKKELRNAARHLSRQWRGTFRNGDPYRDTPEELFADVLSALLNDPEWVNRNHPDIHDTFRGLMDGKPGFRYAYDSVVDWITTGSLPEKISEQMRRSFAASRQKLAEGEKLPQQSTSSLVRRMTVTPWTDAFDLEGRPTQLGDRIVDKLEAGDTFAARRISLLRDDFAGKVQPHLDKIRTGGEEARDIFGEWLVANRVVNERRAAGQWIEQNPAEAAQMLEAVFQAAPAVGAKWRPKLAALGANPTGTDLYDLAAAVLREVHDLGETVVANVERAINRAGLGVRGSPVLAAFNVRGMLLNPSGLTPESATASLARIRGSLTAAEYSELEAAAREFLDSAHQVMVEAHQMGLISTRVFNEIVVPNRRNYVPFAVADYWDGHVGAGIKNQYGTARDIIDPVVALQQRLASMLHWQQRQGQVMLLMEAYRRSGYPITPTRELDHVNEILSERSKNRGDDTSRFVLWRDGRPWLVELPGNPGKTFEKAMERRLAHEEFARLYYTSKWSSWNRIILSLYTVLNPAFVAFRNPIRDVRTTLEAVGTRGTLGELSNVRRRWRMARNYAEAAFGGTMIPEVRELVEDGTLPPPQIASTLAADPVALHEMLVNGTILAGEVYMGRRGPEPGRVAKAFEAKLRPWLKFAALLEALPKIMARDAALRGGVNTDLAAWIGKRAGIPNPGIGGTYSGFIEAFLPWTRVHIQGMRRTLDIARDPRLRRRFAARFALMEAAPRIVQYLIAAGAVAALAGMDDDDDSWLATVGEFFRRVSPYKAALDNIIPLGFRDVRTGEFHSLFSVIGRKRSHIPQHWEAVSFRMPSSEEGRLWGAMIYNILAGITPESTGRRDQGALANLGDWITSSLLPQPSPVMESAANMFSMLVLGRNPKDSFRGAPVANQSLFDAGWGHGRGQAIIGAGFNELGFVGEVGSLIAQSLGLDPRAVDPSRTTADPLSILAKIPMAKSMLAFDNYAPYRQNASETQDEARIRARSRLLMERDVLTLFEFYGRNVNRQKSLGPRDRAMFNVAKAWHSNVWGDSKSPEKIYPRAKAAVGKDGSKEAAATVKRDLARMSAPYVVRFEEARRASVKE